MGMTAMKKLKIILLCAMICAAAINTVALAQSVGANIDMSDDSPPVSGVGWTYENSVYTILDGANVVITENNQEPEASCYTLVQ